MRDSPKYSCLNEESDIKCTQAYSVLENLFKNCESRLVTLKEVTDLKQNKKKLLDLYSACFSTSSDKEHVQDKEEFELKLDQCYTQAKQFLDAKVLLSLFCDHLNRSRMFIEGKKYIISVFVNLFLYLIGLKELEKCVGNNYELYSLQQLGTVHNNVLHIIPFEEYINILSILENFNSLFKVYENDFVKYFFKSLVRSSIKSKVQVNLQNFVEDIWNPFFKRSCIFIESIRDRSIKLREIDEIESHCTKSDRLESQLLSLFCGLEVCRGRSPSIADRSWILKPVNQIQTYVSLCEQAKAARMVLQIKEKLELTGDFDIVEHVAHKVSETMQDQPLSSIDISVGAVASFLKDMASSKQKSDSIEIFSNCLDIVTWMKNGKPFFLMY